MIWRERRVLLIILGVLFAANVIFFMTYRVQYQSRLDEMDERLAQVEGQLAQSRKARAEAEQSLLAYRKVENEVQTILDEQWSTQPRRLTIFIEEVKRLAEASNAVPKTLSFSQSDVEATGTRRRGAANAGAREVGISFNVEATYNEVRRMINLFELSNQFVIIDQIGLSEGGANRLSLNLKLKTLFREEPPPAAGNRL